MASEKEYDIEPNGESDLQPVVGVAERGEELVGSIGQTVETATEAVHDTLRRTKRGVRVAMKNVSDDIQTSTCYVTGNGMGGAIEDVEALIRRYPFHALVIGFSIGCLLSRPWKR